MTTIPSQESAAGLICPSCSGVVPVVEGTRIVKCPYCDTHSLIQGDRGIMRWQVRRKINRDGVEEALDTFLSDVRKARDLRRNAKISEVMLAYVPFWRVDATVAGWLFGRVRSGDDDTKPAEFSIFEPMNWNDAALDVGDLAINRITVEVEDLLPYNGQQMHAEAMVFDPTESAVEAMAEAERYFNYEADRQSKQKTTHYQNIQMLSPMLTLAYYPVWIVRYTYHQRNYQVSVDGVTGAVIAGKAPGSTLYRTITLVSALAAGTFILVNGSILLLMSSLTDDDGFGMVLLPAIMGLLIMFWGYRNFRFGEEVEDRRRQYGKAIPERSGGLFTVMMSEQQWSQVLESSRTAVINMSEARQRKDRDS